MREILIASKNPGKFKEMMEVLDGLPFKFLFLGDLEVEDENFEENGETFQENAYKKAAFYGDLFSLPTIAEDSGIVVEALRGELGIKTRRWGAGEFADDREWIDYFMRRMARENNRRAKFVCNSCFLDGDKKSHFEGETLGEITAKLEAPIMSGLPLSSVFLPDGADKVYAALSPQEKNAISHRGKAMHSLRDFLADHHAASQVQ